ncbi:Pentatricopeptide repeat-containing protein 5, mitochondrial [Leucoagaricus sp. SymC.cos]|nr:Pentatricopeptide repeat-containing protein 5, mitochondrial [Leucoagaricus sp. SymC.cos]
MLPKVATHFLHTTSRAAAQAVQTPLRNVLQTGSSGGSNLGTWNGPSSSNWGGHGPGTGSAKQNTGSRYYSSFNAAGRAVSQANAVSANVDGTFSQSDENDDHFSRRVVVIQTQSGNSTKRPRIRSSSVSLTKAESLGVLKTLQLQGRSRFFHTAIEAAPSRHSQPLPPLSPSRPRRNSTSSSDGLDRPASPVRNFTVAAAESGSQPQPDVTARPRRNSTSSTHSLDRSTFELVDPQVEPVVRSRRNSTSSIDEYQQSDLSIETKPTTPPQSPQVSKASRVSLSTTPPPRQNLRFPELVEAKFSRDPHRVAEAVALFRASAKDATTEDFNLALDALFVTREAESAMPMLEVYNDMIKHSVHPNVETYRLLISSLVAREGEIGKTMKYWADKKRRGDLFNANTESKTDALQQQIDILSLEQRENYATVMSLYSVAKSTVSNLPVQVYLDIVRACLHNSNADGAIEAFRHAEQSFDRLAPRLYRYMIRLYGKFNSVTAAEQVFQRYITAGREGRLDDEGFALEYQKKHVLVWNAMIDTYFKCGLPDKAVDLLSQMMSSPAGLDFTVADTPLPTSLTYLSILEGFCASGDIKTALTWYHRLLEQGIKTQSPHTPSQEPIKPSAAAGLLMFDALAANGYISELNQIYPTFDLSKDEMHFVPFFMFQANIGAIQDVADTQQVKDVLNFLAYDIIPVIRRVRHKQQACNALNAEFLKRGLFDDSLKFMEDFVLRRLSEIETIDGDSTTPASLMTMLRAAFLQYNASYIGAALEQNAYDFEAALTLMQLARVIGVPIPERFYKTTLHAHGVTRFYSHLPVDRMSLVDWEELLTIAFKVERSTTTTSEQAFGDVPNYAFGGIFTVFEDLARYQVDINKLPVELVTQSIKHLVAVYGPQAVSGAFDNFGPAFRRALDESGEIASVAVGRLQKPQKTRSKWGNLVVDANQSKFVDDALKHNNDGNQVAEAYQRLKVGLKYKKTPMPRVIGRLIQGLGRQGDVEKVQELYVIAQDALKSLEMQQDALREGWVCVEDSMIIALAHAGDIDNAHVHRSRLVEQGAAPSADAYGALILYVKDTTDDVSNAMMLFREAVEAKVEMNIYLYNNIISKLAKARKADYALELFQRMKAQGIKTSSITYGALIGACARVGDVQSSEALFAEMVEQKNFKPRVPPYNTMIQLYTMTKPNRERALWFYEQLDAAGVRPTAHTYKLLLDAYGSIEPVDIASMEAVFAELKKNTHVEVQGSHYASLINAYGCVQRDLNKAIAIFDSVPSRSGALDAVVFESVINVLVSHRRTDLIPEYIEKMTAAGIHMTAYIANFLIKGYAIVGELDKAREIFESLVDPPTGVAAPNNHAPHDPSVGNPVGCMEPVYREPSTWEAMVRAELGAGHRGRALDLLHRLKSRQYPEAVYNRISGVMVDHSSLLP